MKFLKGMVLGIILGAAGFWFVQQKAREHPEAERHYEQSAAHAVAAAGAATHHFADDLAARLDTSDVPADKIKEEMARTGKVFRQKAHALGQEAADAATDARIVTTIKAKFVADSDLSVWAISVSCDQGHVALSGAVPSPEAVSKAIALALEPSGVQDVTSTLAIKPKE